MVSRFSAKLAAKAAHIFEMLTEGFASLKGTRNYLLTILLSIAIMLVYALNLIYRILYSWNAEYGNSGKF